MRKGAGWHVGALGLCFTIVGCAGPPDIPVRTHFLQQRLAVVDPNKPCIVEPYPPMDAALVRNRIYVPVRLNGVATIGVLDTGASNSLITPELAAAAKLKVQTGYGQLIGVSGNFRPDVAFLEAVEIGSIRRTFVGAVKVYPFDGSHGLDVGALVGLDWLDHFDYDFDLAHNRIRPFRTSNCLIIDPPWRTTSTGLAITRGISDGLNKAGQEVFTTFGLTAHLSIPVAFEGGMIDAMLDTGSTTTIMSHEAALDAGATAKQLRADPVAIVRGLNGKDRPTRRHSFADVAIGEEEIHGFSVLVEESYNRDDDAMILGADFLAKRHLWLSLTTNAVFIDSGEPMKPTPPFDKPHQIAGSPMPAFPGGAKAHAASVGAACTVGADGALSGCKITNSAGDVAFDKAVLDWLTGGAGPVMQPRYENGQPVAEIHTWQINFQPP